MKRSIEIGSITKSMQVVEIHKYLVILISSNNNKISIIMLAKKKGRKKKDFMNDYKLSLCVCVNEREWR